MEIFGRIVARLKKFWAGLANWQRFLLVGAVVLVLSAIILMVVWVGKPSYEPLFSNLDIEDEAAIVAYLKENKISYRIDPSASAILLPRDAVYETRLELARTGLPKGGVSGYELFDDSKIGMSEFQQKITYIRALEGELARTIRQINAVDYARINIVIPEPHLFLEQQKPSTASVLIRLKPGRNIGAEQIRAIVHLVGHSVEGLTPDNITVVDTSGNVLSDLIDQDMLVYSDTGRTVSSVQRELERQQELEMERKVRAMLEKVFGPGKVVVRIKVDLDFDKRRSSSREYLPGPNGKGVIRSQQNTEENYVGSGKPVGGVPGTTTNIPGYAVSSQQAGAGEYNKSDVTTNFEITTHESEQVQTPGRISRLTASVLVDGDLSDEELDDLKSLVAPAMGFNSERGDQIAIQSMTFSSTFANGMASQFRAERRRQLLFTLFALAVLLAGIAIGALYWMRRRKQLKQVAGETISGDSQNIPSLDELLTSPEMLGEQGELAVLEEQLRNYAMKNPEDFALFVREWIAEEV